MGKRVTKRKPREWWVGLWGDGTITHFKRRLDVLLERGHFPFPVPVKVREVVQPRKRKAAK